MTFLDSTNRLRSLPARCVLSFLGASLWVLTSASVAMAACGVCGDVNGDGTVNIADALFIVQKANGLRTEVPCPPRADLNNSGNVDIVDALFVGQHTVGLRPLLCLQVDTPEPLTQFPSHEARVTGSVVGTGSLTCNGREATRSGNSFSVDVVLREGRNPITCAAVGAVETQLLTTSREVTADTTPPRLVIESPADGATVTTMEVEVAGMINDLAAGTTINDDDCRVMVNGVPAQVNNRSFVVERLLLQPGKNTITATAVDRVGNEASTSIEVTVQDRVGQRLLPIAGAGQAGRVRTELPDPLVVLAVDQRGDPVAGQNVRFEVIRGDGQLRAFPAQGVTVDTTTDEQGLARAQFTLGGRSGDGNHRVRATALGFVGEVEFCTTATVGAAQRITAVSGGGQTGAVGEAVPSPLTALITDADGNPVPGVEVTFRIVDGGANFDGAPTAVRTSDLDGLVTAIPTLGAQAGIDVYSIVADFEALTEAPATFKLSGMVKGAPSATTFRGIVLDGQDNPVPGATVQIDQQGVVLHPVPQAVTDEQGRFSVANVPVGPVRLIVDGATTTRPGKWPVLEFDTVTVAGRENDLGHPLRILPLDEDSKVVIENGGPPEDVTLRLAGVAGAELTIFARSVTCPVGPTCEFTWTQVNLDRVPMPPPNGSTFTLAATLQPAGVAFDPPARMCIPNSGAAPGTQLELYSFDHDISEFIAIGTATVTEDGSQLCSDPGFGMVKSGWGGGAPPPPPDDCVVQCNDGKECTTDRVEDPPCACRYDAANEGGSCGGESAENSCIFGTCEGGDCKFASRPDDYGCDDGLYCTEDDKCSGGTCKGTKVEPNKLTETTIKVGLLDIILQRLQAWLDLVEFKGINLPEVTGSIKTKAYTEVCCEPKKKMTIDQTAGGTLILPFYKTKPWYPPFPPWTGKYSYKLFGKVIEIKYGVFTQASFSARLSLERTMRECRDDTCWKGSPSLNADGTFGYSAEVANPIKDPDCGCNYPDCIPGGPVPCCTLKEKKPCKLVYVEGSGTSGVNLNLAIGCGKASGGVGHNGVKLNGVILLAEGTFLEYRGTKSLILYDPGKLTDINFEFGE